MFSKNERKKENLLVGDCSSSARESTREDTSFRERRERRKPNFHGPAGPYRPTQRKGGKKGGKRKKKKTRKGTICSQEKGVITLKKERCFFETLRTKGEDKRGFFRLVQNRRTNNRSAAETDIPKRKAAEPKRGNLCLEEKVGEEKSTTDQKTRAPQSRGGFYAKTRRFIKSVTWR